MTRSNFFVNKLAENKAVLAPMAGYSDAAFRLLCNRFGSAWSVTEMVSAKAILNGNYQGIEIAEPHSTERDFVIQIYGADAELMAEAAEILIERYNPVAIDINMGCPVKKIVAKGMGSSLLQDPPKAAKIVSTLSNRLNKAISVKMRLGYDTVNAAEVAQRLEDAGAALIAIHGRTAKQKYSGKADWKEIAKIGKILKIPVVGSGDITTKQEYDKYRSMGLGVMIARASLGQPWIFAQLRGEPIPGPKEQINIIFEHAVLHCAWYKNIGLSEKAAMEKFRSKLMHYLPTLKDKSFLTNIKSLDDLQSFLEKQFELKLNKTTAPTEKMKRKTLE